MKGEKIMEQTLNYGIIIMDNMRISGKVDYWEYLSNGSVNVVIDGVRYKVGVNNVLLMHREDI